MAKEAIATVALYIPVLHPPKPLQETAFAHRVLAMAK